MYIDIERMKEALEGEPIEIPVGLKPESFNKFITSLGECELKNSDFHLAYSALGLALSCYYAEVEHERFGQWFCNNFIKEPWPELFYEEDKTKSKTMVEQWLDDNCYVRSMPERT